MIPRTPWVRSAIFSFSVVPGSGEGGKGKVLAPAVVGEFELARDAEHGDGIHPAPRVRSELDRKWLRLWRRIRRARCYRLEDVGYLKMRNEQLLGGSNRARRVR